MSRSAAKRNFSLVVVAGLAIALATGCVPQPKPAPPPPPTAAAIAVTPGRYAIAPGESRITIRVRRAGPLAALGHNHVITSDALEGTIAVTGEPASSRATLRLPVASLVVDAPESRAAAGDEFASVPSEADVRGTRENLLGPRVLDATHHPAIEADVRVEGIEGDRVRSTLWTRIAGRTATFPVDARVSARAGELRVSAAFVVDHATLGLTPFSVLGGALRVADEIEVEVEIVARTDQPPP